MAIAPLAGAGPGRRAARSVDRRIHHGRVSRRRRDVRRSPTSSRFCGRARSSSRPAGFDDARALVAELRLDARVTLPAGGLDVRSRVGAADAARAAAARTLQGFGLDGPSGRGARRRRARPLPARHAEGRSRARPRDRVPRRRRLPARRPDDAAQPRGDRSGRRRATGSLLHEIDRTMTPMGGRLLRAWLLRPLVALERIQDRLDAVEELAFRATERAKLRETLKTIHDIERLVARARSGRRARAISSRCASRSPPCRACGCCCRDLQAPLVRSLAAELDDLADLRDELDRTLVDEPPAVARDGGVIRDGVDPELDELRAISRSGKQHHRRRWKTPSGAHRHPSLKIRYNRVFGYYIEVSKSNLAQRAGRLSPQADDRRRRAFHHAGAQGVRGEGPRRRRADPRARDRDLRPPAPRVAGEGAAHPGHGARAGVARRARALAETAAAATTRSR